MKASIDLEIHETTSRRLIFNGGNLMSFLKDIFKKRREVKCAVCGEAVQNEFKTEYLKLNGCYGLYIVHYNCSKKRNKK